MEGIKSYHLAAETFLIHIAAVVWVFPRHATNKQVTDATSDDEKHLAVKWTSHFHTDKTETKVNTLVITTISSRGKLNCLMAFPRMISERPFE